jgi:hypothetical protein
LLIYGGIAWLSQSFVYGQGHRQRPILLFLALYASAFVLYVFALWSPSPWSSPIKGEERKKCSEKFNLGLIRSELLVILVFAILFRLVLLFSNPIQEDDFYRYLWDGKVVASGLNPYGVTPSAVMEREEHVHAYADIVETDPNFSLILSRINHPHVPTIYPPLAQGIFGLVALIAPASLLGLRCALLLFDLGLICLIVVLLRQLSLNPAWLLVYAWSSLVIKETLNSTHYDVMPTFFLVSAVLLLLRGKWGVAHVSFALAVLGKLYPMVLFPLFFWRTKMTEGWTTALWGIGITVTVIIAGYAPFLDAGWGLWQGTLTFAEQWQTNSLIFPLLSVGLGNRWGAAFASTVMLAGLILVLLHRLDLRDDRAFLWSMFVTLGALFLLSPVGDPWYFVWLAPLVCVFPLRSWILLSGLLGLYYLSFHFMYHKMAETFRWVIWLEYLPFYGMLWWEWRVARSTNASSPPPESILRAFI